MASPQEQWEWAIRRADRLSLILAWEAMNPHPCQPERLPIICKRYSECYAWANEWDYVWKIPFEYLKKTLDTDQRSVLESVKR